MAEINFDYHPQFVFKSALADFKNGIPVVNQQYKFESGELARDIWRNGTAFSSITGFVGSASITMLQTETGVKVQIFNITSLYSGDLAKDIYGKLGLDKDQHSAKSYVRDINKTTPYGNISETFNLFIPNSSPLLKK